MYKSLSLLWPILAEGIGNRSQSRDKILYILLVFVFYTITYDASYVANYVLDRFGNAGNCTISTLFPCFLWQWSIPTPFLNHNFKLFLYVYFSWSTYLQCERIFSFNDRYNMRRTIDIQVHVIYVNFYKGRKSNKVLYGQIVCCQFAKD